MEGPMQQPTIHAGAGVRPVDAFVEAYGLVFRNLSTVGRLLLVPLGVMAAGSYWSYDRQILALQRLAETGEETGFDPAQVIPFVFQLLAFVAFATAWHRWILMGPGAAVPGLGLAWRRVEWRYLLALVWIYVAIFLVLAACGLVLLFLSAAIELFALAVVIALLGGVAAIFVFCRLCLVLPGAAVGAAAPLRTARQRSFAKVFRMFVAFLLVFVPVVLADLAVYLALFPGEMAELGPAELAEAMRRIRLPFLAAGVVLYGLTAALFVALLSVLYRQVTGYEQAEVATE